MKKITFLRFTSLASTNQKLYQLATQNFPAFTVVSTPAQTKGKGQRGSVWKSTANKNLTLSLLLRFNHFKAENSFLISLWFTVYLHKFLTTCQIYTQIKWPNDIILHKKKIGGILIENKIKNANIIFSVIGLGLNVYQEDFKGLPKASSIYKEEKHFSLSLKKLEEDLIAFLFQHKKQLHINLWDELLNYYYQHLLGFEKVNTFQLNGKKENGIIKGITKEGQLIVFLENAKEIKNFDIKEIRLLY